MRRDFDDSRLDFNGSDSDLRLLLSKTGRKKSERNYFKISRSVAKRITRRFSNFTKLIVRLQNCTQITFFFTVYLK